MVDARKHDLHILSKPISKDKALLEKIEKYLK